MIEDRLRSQASWHPSPAVARVSGPFPTIIVAVRWVQGQARSDGMGPGRGVSDPSHHVASHRIALVVSLPACLAYLFLHIVQLKVSKYVSRADERVREKTLRQGG